MGKNKSAAKIEMTKFDDLFETDESREDKSRERLIEVELDRIRDFPEHPYLVKDDESMAELIDSIKSYGLMQPVLVRPVENEMYEMVSGHRRKRAFELAGLEKIPARVKEMTRDEAILMMVDSNLYREEILPSEKARAYKMRLDAMKRQAGRPAKENCVPLAHNSEMPRSRAILAEQVGESQDNVRRYIRLTELIPELLDMVDEKRIALRPAVEISYLSKEAQQELVEAIELNDATPSHAQTIKMRKFQDEGKLTAEVIDYIMSEEKPNQREKPAIRDKRITSLIPQSVPAERQCDYVIKALEYFNRFMERKRNSQER